MKATHDIYIKTPDGLYNQVQWATSEKHARALIDKGIMPALLPGYQYVIRERL